MQRRRIAYRELADTVRHAVRHGEFADGAPLPTELTLAATHQVSRQTVRRAMQELVADGLVYRVPGRGTFAVNEPHPYVRSIGSITDLMGLSSDTQLRVVEPLCRVHAPAQAAQLAALESEVCAVSFTRHHGGPAFCYTSVFLPGPVARLLADVPALHRRRARTSDTVIGLLDQRLDRPIVRAEQTITAVRASSDVSVPLGTVDTAILLKVQRLYQDDRGQRVELAVSFFLPEHYEYRVTLRRDPR